jgi:hypothetical protein
MQSRATADIATAEGEGGTNINAWSGMKIIKKCAM